MVSVVGTSPPPAAGLPGAGRVIEVTWPRSSWVYEVVRFWGSVWLATKPRVV